MPYLSDQELARLQYVLTKAIDEARTVDGGIAADPDQSNPLEFALTEALILLRLVERSGETGAKAASAGSKTLRNPKTATATKRAPARALQRAGKRKQ